MPISYKLTISIFDLSSLISYTSSQGNSIIYCALHLTHVSEPGFNTLIFGLTWRGAGFGYHSDQKQNIEEKNVTMTNNQPVVSELALKYLPFIS